MDKEKFSGELRILQRLNKYEFAFEAYIMRTGPVQNGQWEFRNLETNYRSFAGQPVLVAYTKYGRQVGDGHNSEEKIDPKTGEKYRSFTAATAERIVGMISEDMADLTLVERDGHTWLRVRGRIWTQYAKELIDKLMRTGSMEVSVEAIVTDGHKEDGREVYDAWDGIGFTILGDDVAPGVPNAHIRAIATTQEEFERMKLRVASLVKEDGETQKPQKNTEQKGRKILSYLSKGQLRELQAKFGDSWRVMAAMETTSAVVVCLMAENGKTAVYRMESVSDGVVPERIRVVNAQVHFCADEGDEPVCVDACDMLESMGERVRNAEDRCERAERECADLKSAMEKMAGAEEQRRLAAAKKVADDTLAAFNINRADKVEESRLASLRAEIEAGKFTACTDENSQWIGDKAVEKEVLSLCAAAVMEADRKAAEGGRTIHIMDKLGAGGPIDDGTVNGLLARIGIQQ